MTQDTIGTDLYPVTVIRIWGSAQFNTSFLRSCCVAFLIFGSLNGSVCYHILSMNFVLRRKSEGEIPVSFLKAVGK